ncbi:MAG: flippase-like domain-containing protein [Bacteroidetes bacterium]|nr:flippase-like domain-containing protein [Bacteroidota bacterium]
MNKRTKSIIQFTVLLGVGILLAWLSIKSVWGERDKIADSFATANYFWVGVSIAIAFLSHYLRAFRWNYLLKPLGYSVKPANALGAVLVGYFANYGLPRMGELTRCTLVAKYDDVPFEVALGTVITERIVDMLLLVAIFVLTLFAQFSQLKTLAVEYIVDPLMGKLSGISAQPVKFIILISLAIIAFIGFMLIRKRLAKALTGKFGNIIKGFGNGLSSVKDIDKKFQFIALSIAIWASYFYSLYACFFAFAGTSDLGHSECLVLLLFGTFGVVFSPGGLGAYPAIITALLTATYHVEIISAVAFPWMAWTSQFILVVVLGIISLILLPIINKNKSDVVS